MAQTRTARYGATIAAEDAGLRRFFSNVFLMMALALGVTAIAANVVMSSPALLAYAVSGTGVERSPTIFWWAAVVIELGSVVWMSSWTKSSDVSFVRGMTVFLIYAAFNGFTLAPVIDLYTQASVVKAFAVSASMFGVSALWGHTTKRNILGMGSFLLMGLIGLIIAMLVNLVLRSPAIDFAVSVIGVVVFCSLTAWDMQALRAIYDREGSSVSLVVSGALSLYLDFINLLLLMLRFLGVRKD